MLPIGFVHHDGPCVIDDQALACQLRRLTSAAKWWVFEFQISKMTIRQPSDEERRQWEAEFEAASKRSLEERMNYSFIKTYKPVLDDAPYRTFDTMEEYRQWCDDNLPEWLGYRRVKDDPIESPDEPPK